MSVSENLDSTLLFLSLPHNSLSSALALFIITLLILWFYPGGVAWALSKAHLTIPGPPGIIFAFSGTAAHRVLAKKSDSLHAKRLMAFSVGFSRFIISSHPDTAKEILNSSSFADRPVKESAYELLFHRAMGFAPFGEYWRNLRRISATYLFSPRRIQSFSESRREIGESMVREIKELMKRDGVVCVKRILHFGSLNNVMVSVFGKRYEFSKGTDGVELEEMVREGYELLGVFNWGDHFPLLRWLDLQGVRRRCRRLVSRVNAFVGKIIDEHRLKRCVMNGGAKMEKCGGDGDFVDVLLDLEGHEKLSDSDMVAVLWVCLLINSFIDILSFFFFFSLCFWTKGVFCFC